MPLPFHVDEVMPGDEQAEVIFVLFLRKGQVTRA